MLTISLPVHQVCVTMVTVHLESLPVLRIVCHIKSSRHKHCPWSGSGRKFPPIEEKEFLARSRVASELEKVGSVYLCNGFRKDARDFLKALTSTVLSTVTARSAIGQGLSCFCPDFFFLGGGGGDHAPFYLFGQLLDGVMELGWVRGSSLEASKAEYWSFVRDQWQLQCISTRSRPNVGNILPSWSSQSRFQARRLCTR